MVAAHYLSMYLSLLNFVVQPLGCYEIVYAPAGVLLASAEAVRPPRICNLVGVLKSERIGKALRQQRAELLALLVGESGIASVCLRVLDVNLLMSHVHIATHDYGLLRIEFLEIGLKIVLPSHAIVEAFQLVLTVWRVDGYEKEVGHLEGYYAPLMVVLLYPDAVGNAKRLVLGEYCRSAASGWLLRRPESSARSRM